MKDRSRIVDFYLQKITDRDFEIYQVRKDLESNNFNEEEIKVIVRLVDNELQRRALVDTNNKKASELIYLGAVITIVGLVITIGTYTGLIVMGNSFVILYGPILGGLSVLLTGLSKKKRG